ncbi:28299_t:CDS:2 [Dentiscutata erythropus]|uniref:28299_t:CDS:1 n=1 Tax=Dentiscutata erythropus TaxID=1348616 RepID=A0A9N8Z354_9GLOM|nr:28299_t:CDS:2 [Dentiscutata erythropus]
MRSSMNCRFPTLLLLITSHLILIINSLQLNDPSSQNPFISERGEGEQNNPSFLKRNHDLRTRRVYFDNYDLNNNKFKRRHDLSERNFELDEHNFERRKQLKAKE